MPNKLFLAISLNFMFLFCCWDTRSVVVVVVMVVVEVVVVEVVVVVMVMVVLDCLVK